MIETVLTLTALSLGFVVGLLYGHITTTKSCREKISVLFKQNQHLKARLYARRKVRHWSPCIEERENCESIQMGNWPYQVSVCRARVLENGDFQILDILETTEPKWAIPNSEDDKNHS